MPPSSLRPSGINAEIAPEDVRELVFAARGRIALARVTLQCWLQPRTRMQPCADAFAAAAETLAAQPEHAAKAEMAKAAAVALRAEADRRATLRGTARDKDDEMRAGARMVREWAAAEMKIIHDFARRIAPPAQLLPSIEEAAKIYEVFPKPKRPARPKPWESERAQPVISEYAKRVPQLPLEQAIREINGKPTNADARLKRLRLGGGDKISAMALSELEAALSAGVTAELKQALRLSARRIPEPQLIAAAQRWALRGLRPRLAARKAWLDHKAYGQ